MTQNPEQENIQWRLIKSKLKTMINECLGKLFHIIYDDK